MADFRRGVELAPGIYDYHGELHVDEERYIRAAGGDPRCERDRKTARATIARIAAEHGIAVEERDQ